MDINIYKTKTFQLLVVSILLYNNAVTWTMNKTLTKALTGGGYNRLLRYALNIRCASDFAGHCYRSFESVPQPVMDVLFLSLKGTRTQGNRSNYYRKLLFCEEMLLDEVSLQNAYNIGKR